MQPVQQRVSFDSSNLSKRTSFELDGDAGAQSRKRRSMDSARVAGTPPAGFVPPMGAPWAPFQMPMNPMMGMMGMPYCFPPPFIPPFMMPAAMAMWQQAVHQASATVRVTDQASPQPPAPPPPLHTCGSTKNIPHCPSLPTVPETSASDGSESETVAPTEDFATFIDKFLGDDDDGFNHLGLADSFGSSLNLLGGSMTELSECCKPLDLKFTRDDSHLDLLGLDLDLEEKSVVGLDAL